MNSPLRRKNTINKEPIGSTVVKNKPEPKTPVIFYDYEAAISQPDIPIYSKVDNDIQNASWSEDLMHSGDVPKVVKNKKSFVSKAADMIQENSIKMDTDRKSYIPKNKISKIPRIKPPIKPNSCLPKHGESHVYPSAKLSVRNELKCSTEIKSTADNEKKELMSEYVSKINNN
ncbi:uncharacterized protein LOC105829041 isoform X4 [Monomorium pharaonis]|uniref:uncharacterized protein LOC105829041 isoform X4 n=1 Tax=Monomorium pharaonis TaxID=307658 RepID=UPI001747CA97|nr:uncharacterized protein LOC105829041 isoform X4 [Monomorium pharaonis]